MYQPWSALPSAACSSPPWGRAWRTARRNALLSVFLPLSLVRSVSRCWLPWCREGATMTIPIRSLLIANRGEIAIRIMRAANELDIRTIGLYAHEDRFALHRFQADESYLVGAGRGPIEAYLDINDVLRIA